MSAVPAVRAGSARWWIEAAGKLWGPYPRERLAQFVGQGRLTASSLAARTAGGPFAPAALDPDLSGFFVAEPARTPPPVRPQPVVAVARPQPEPPQPEAAAAPGALRPVLVFAALSATRDDLFEAALAAQGESVAIAPGLWLVRARCAAAPLRNTLSRRLREGDVLWVSELDAARAAWFALPGETDRAVRRALQ